MRTRRTRLPLRPLWNAGPKALPHMQFPNIHAFQAQRYRPSQRPFFDAARKMDGLAKQNPLCS